MRAAGLLALVLLAPVTAAAAEIVIEAGRLTPPVLTVAFDETVTFVNRSGRMVHIDFLGPATGHRVFQVPGRIRATFHQPGRHPYVVHFENARRGELRGAVEVQEWREPGVELPVCRSITVEDICLEP